MMRALRPQTSLESYIGSQGLDVGRLGPGVQAHIELKATLFAVQTLTRKYIPQPYVAPTSLH